MVEILDLEPHTATDLLAKKNPDGTRSKYQPPGHKDAVASTGSDRTVAEMLSQGSDIMEKQ